MMVKFCRGRTSSMKSRSNIEICWNSKILKRKKKVGKDRESMGVLRLFFLAAQVLSWTVCSLSMAHRQVQYRHSPVPGSVIELVILILKDTNYQHTEKLWCPRHPKDYLWEKKKQKTSWSFRQHLIRWCAQLRADKSQELWPWQYAPQPCQVAHEMLANPTMNSKTNW